MKTAMFILAEKGTTQKFFVTASNEYNRIYVRNRWLQNARLNAYIEIRRFGTYSSIGITT